MQKIVVILGPTSSGKTGLGIRLAKAFYGEVVSADSRQVYRGFNLCSGKATTREMGGVPHHLLDIASPRRTFTVARYVRRAHSAIRAIAGRGHLPLVVGGTGFYIRALAEGISLPEVPPNLRLRKELATKTPAQLFAFLRRADPRRAKTIDVKNPRRLIRALEIAHALGTVPSTNATPLYQTLYLGLNPDPELLRRKIHERLLARLKNGMVQEIKNLHGACRLSWNRLESFGLELRYVSRFLQHKLTREQMMQELEQAIAQYAKRQMTWFRKYPNSKINWIASYSQARALIKAFLAHSKT
jgi:tRNA dimethylallyltransferase